MESITEKIASEHLGKRVSGSETYAPNLLVAVPREENRKQYSIDNNELPFEGFDTWHAYEFSALTENGIPVTRVLKINYNCNNDYIIESKSLKLYLNSFNMTRLGNTVNECLNICKTKIEEDLSKKLKTEVKVNFLTQDTKITEIFANYKNIMNYVDETKIKITDFKENPNLLTTETTDEEKEYRLKFDSLRSNCRVTHQPDFGDAFIYYKSKKHIKEESLLEYLVSFRGEYHFHEECCEMIYKRLQDILNPEDEILISALYTRRGGIDINPIRWSKNISQEELENSNHLKDLTTLTHNGIKQ